jgi:hypothetical protein
MWREWMLQGTQERIMHQSSALNWTGGIDERGFDV